MEELRPVLSGLIGGAIAALLLRWVSKEKDVRLPAGSVRYGRRMKAISLVLLAVGLFIGYAATQASPDQRWTALAVGGSLFAVSVWLVLETFLVSANVTEECLIHRSPWRKTRAIPWTAVTDYSYSNVMSWHVLHTSNYGTVRLSVYLSGVDQVAEKLSPPQRDDA
jgi:hypothetical protein